MGVVLEVVKLVTKFGFVMVCDVKWGFGEASKKAKILEIAVYGSSFTVLWGFNGGFMVGCEGFQVTRLRICDNESRLL